MKGEIAQLDIVNQDARSLESPIVFDCTRRFSRTVGQEKLPVENSNDMDFLCRFGRPIEGGYDDGN